MTLQYHTRVSELALVADVRERTTDAILLGSPGRYLSLLVTLTRSICHCNASLEIKQWKWRARNRTRHREVASWSGPCTRPLLISELGSTRSSVGSAMTIRMGVTEKVDILVVSKLSISAMEGRSKRTGKNRVSMTDGHTGEQLREVSRILLVVTTTRH
jgi:hypothetical protein